jgi:hypothetical protein
VTAGTITSTTRRTNAAASAAIKTIRLNYCSQNVWKVPDA